MKALVSTFNQEKALAGAFSVIVKTDGAFAAVILLYTYFVERFLTQHMFARCG